MALETLAVNVIARTSVFEKNMQRSRRTVSGFGNHVSSVQQKVMGLAKTMLAAGGLGYAFKKVITAASDAQEIMSKFDTVFKDLSTVAKQWSIEFADSVGRARQDVQKWMAGLQDTFVPLGITRQKSLELAKSLTALAVDVASFNNVADADVIRDFTSALVGNHETVRKFGIIISENALKLEAQAQGINKNYKQLSDLEKVQLRYSLILKGTSDAQGDAIRTASSFANQMKRLKAQFVNTSEIIGSKFLPRMTALIETLNKGLGTISERTIDNVLSFGKWVIKLYLAVKAVSVIKIAIRGLISLYKALAKAKAVALSLFGPKGWATLAAGAVVATVALVGIDKAFSVLEKDIETVNKTQQSVKGVGDAATKTAENIKTMTKNLGGLKEVNTLFDRLTDTYDQINATETQTMLKKFSDAGATGFEMKLARWALEKIDNLKTSKNLLKENIELEKQLATFGMTEAQKKLFDLKAMIPKGADADYIKNYNKELGKFVKLSSEFSKKQEMASAFKSLKDSAKSLADSLKTPVERFKEMRDQLDKMLKSGLLTNAQYAKGLDKYGKDILGGSERFRGGEARQFRSEHVSVAGLQMGGIETKNYLRLIEENTRKVASNTRPGQGGRNNNPDII